jgi:hypothetical protein
VIGTAELAVVAVAVDQLPAAVQAGVVEGLQFAGGGTRDDDGEAGDVVDERVAHLRDLGGAAHGLPRALPDVLDLFLVELAGQVAIHREVVRPEIRVGVLAQAVRHRVHFPVQQLLVRRPGRAGPGARSGSLFYCVGHGKQSPCGLRIGREYKFQAILKTGLTVLL